MGNQTSNLSSSILNAISYDPARDPDAMAVRCKCSETTTTATTYDCILATYRCQIVSDSDVLSCYPDFQRHLHNYEYNPQNKDSSRIYRFIGCDRCLSFEIKYRFAHHKDGWVENSKHHIDYELIHPKRNVPSSN